MLIFSQLFEVDQIAFSKEFAKKLNEKYISTYGEGVSQVYGHVVGKQGRGREVMPKKNLFKNKRK